MIPHGGGADGSEVPWRFRVGSDDTEPAAEPTPGGLRRQARRIERLGSDAGLSAEDHTEIVSGLGAAIDRTGRELLDRVIAKDSSVSVAELNRAVRAGARPRALTRSDWRIGEPLPAREHEAVAVRDTRRSGLVQVVPSLTHGAGWTFGIATAASGALLAMASSALEPNLPLLAGVTTAPVAGAVLTAVWRGRRVVRALRVRRDPALTHRLAALAVSHTLQAAGRIPPLSD